MSANDIDDFAANIFEGSLQLVNQLPDTVYRFVEIVFQTFSCCFSHFATIFSFTCPTLQCTLLVYPHKQSRNSQTQSLLSFFNLLK